MDSPVLIFRPDGTVDKVIKYTAYGQVVSDSSPAMKLPLGYKGGMIIGKLYLLSFYSFFETKV